MSGGEGISEGRPVPIPHGLTVGLSQGKGPPEHILPPPGEEDRGCSKGSWDEGQGPPEREGNAGEGPRTGAETQLSVPSCTGQREGPSPQERRGGLGAQDPGELSFHISAAELSRVLLLVPSERASDTRPPPLHCKSLGRAWLQEAVVQASRKIPPACPELLIPGGLS